MLYHFRAVAALLIYALVAGAAEKNTAPRFFEHHSASWEQAISLRSVSNNFEPEVLHEIQVARIVRQRRRLSARQLQQRPSANSTTSSAENGDDVDQSVGLLSNAYYAPLNVSVGNVQSLFVQLDTGSSDLWIVSSTCSTAQCSTDTVYKFDEGQSQSFEYLQLGRNVNMSGTSEGDQQVNVTVSAQSSQSTAGAIAVAGRRRNRLLGENEQRLVTDSSAIDSSATIPFSVVYDDGTAATGVLGQDNVALAHLSSAQQIFGLVDTTNVTLAQQGISGVLGMGFPRGSAIARSLIGTTTTGSDFPLLTTLFDAHNSSYPFFTLHLNSTGGSLTLGAADPTILPTQNDRGLVEWHDVIPFPSGNTARPSNATVNRDAQSLDSYLYWAIEVAAAGMNGSAVNLTPTYGEQVDNRSIALLDSGAPGIVGPPAAVDALFGQIDGARHVGAGRYVVPCSIQQRMFFSFGGRNYTLLPSDYIIGPASGNPYLCLSWPAAVQGSADGVDWVLGQPFMRAQYTLFSLGIAGREPPKIGLYPLRAAADATDVDVVFAPEQEASVSAYVHSVVPIATTLPNSLVAPVYAQSTSQYVFSNATTTPAIGLYPSRAPSTSDGIAPSTYEAILSASTGNDKLPVLVSTVEQIPLPSNPAQDQSTNAGSHISLRSDIIVTWSILNLLSIVIVSIL